MRPFLQRYCYGCHGPEKHKAALDLSRDSTATAVANNLHRWEQVLDRLRREEMPPESVPHLWVPKTLSLGRIRRQERSSALGDISPADAGSLIAFHKGGK
jgi:hypothetical protein